MKKRLGELLLEKRLIDVDQLTAALAHQRQWGIRLGAALVANGFIAEGTLMQVLSDALGLPMVDLSKVIIDKTALALVPVRVCEQYEVFPIAVREPRGGRRALLLAMADPLNVTAIDEVAFLSDCIIKAGIAPSTSIDQAIQRHHRGRRIEIAPMNFERSSPRSNSQTGMRGIEVVPPAGERALANNNFVDEISDGERPVLLGQHAQVPPAPAAPFSAVTPPPTPTPTFSGPLPTPPPMPAPLPPPSPLMAQAVDPFSGNEAYDGMPTGMFAMPKPAAIDAAPLPPLAASTEVAPTPAPNPASDREAFEALERKFWALMRVLHRRGQITREEFVAELGEEL